MDEGIEGGILDEIDAILSAKDLKQIARDIVAAGIGGAGAGVEFDESLVAVTREHKHVIVHDIHGVGLVLQQGKAPDTIRLVFPDGSAIAPKHGIGGAVGSCGNAVAAKVSGIKASQNRFSGRQ